MKTYKITSSTPGNEATGTLEEIRKQLIDEAITNNRSLDMWMDQDHAVYPYDDSELDEGEQSPVSLPLTKELLTELASNVWDVPHGLDPSSWPKLHSD